MENSSDTIGNRIRDGNNSNKSSVYISRQPQQ